jgi:ParB-like chromosome segregation protein Spo0J
MNVTKIKLTALRRPERNVRMHTEKQLKEFERSVNMFGQIRPIVVDDELTILAGNGLYEALIRMGWDEADILQVSGLTENQKKKLMLADNKIYGLGVDDHTTLDAFLAELQGDLDIPGYDENILRSMVSEASAVTEEIQQYGLLNSVEIQEIADAKERKAQIMESAQKNSREPEPAQPKAAFAEPEQREPVRQYATCPHCGEKVWL